MNNKAYSGPILTFSFVVLIISLYLSVDISNEGNISYLNLSSQLDKSTDYLAEKEYSMQNYIAQVILSAVPFSYDIEELQQNVVDALVQNKGSSFGTTIYDSNGSLSFSFDFYYNLTPSESVDIFVNKTVVSKLTNLPFLELKTASDDFDLNFLENCINGCALDTYESMLSTCLSELTGTNSYVFDSVLGELPYSNGVINTSFTVHQRNNTLSRKWPYSVGNGTYYQLSC